MRKEMDTMSDTKQNVQQFQCPNCSAPLTYKPRRRSLLCSNCGSEFTIDEIISIERPLTEQEIFDWCDWQAKFVYDGDGWKKTA